MGFKFLKLLTYIIGLCIALIALALGSENPQQVSLNLLFIKIELPLAFLLFVTFLIGAGFAALLFLLRKLKPKTNA